MLTFFVLELNDIYASFHEVTVRDLRKRGYERLYRMIVGRIPSSHILPSSCNCSLYGLDAKVISFNARAVGI